jgi:hypothetical protein
MMLLSIKDCHHSPAIHVLVTLFPSAERCHTNNDTDFDATGIEQDILFVYNSSRYS